MRPQRAVGPAGEAAEGPQGADRAGGAELFCERGYHRVGIDEIAAVVGISGPAVYRHFPNKYAMLAHATRDARPAP